MHATSVPVLIGPHASACGSQILLATIDQRIHVNPVEDIAALYADLAARIWGVPATEGAHT